MASSNRRSKLFRPTSKGAPGGHRKQRGRRSLEFESLEHRLLMAVTPSLSGQVATFTGDKNGNDLLLSVSGGNASVQRRSRDNLLVEPRWRLVDNRQLDRD